VKIRVYLWLVLSGSGSSSYIVRERSALSVADSFGTLDYIFVLSVNIRAYLWLIFLQPRHDIS